MRSQLYHAFDVSTNQSHTENLDLAYLYSIYERAPVGKPRRAEICRKTTAQASLEALDALAPPTQSRRSARSFRKAYGTYR